jgi:hypothetical protein
MAVYCTDGVDIGGAFPRHDQSYPSVKTEFSPSAPASVTSASGEQTDVPTVEQVSFSPRSDVQPAPATIQHAIIGTQAAPVIASRGCRAKPTIHCKLITVSTFAARRSPIWAFCGARPMIAFERMPSSHRVAPL